MCVREVNDKYDRVFRLKFLGFYLPFIELNLDGEELHAENWNKLAK